MKFSSDPSIRWRTGEWRQSDVLGHCVSEPTLQFGPNLKLLVPYLAIFGLCKEGKKTILIKGAIIDSR